MSAIVGRRRTLQLLAKVVHGLLVLPLIQRARSGQLHSIAHAATGRPKGEEMNHDTPGALDPYRLPRHVIPTRYELRLEPDLGNATFTGREAVTLTVTQPTTTIVMNAVDLTISRAEIVGRTAAQQAASIELDEPLQRCRLRFPQALTPGDWRLDVIFQGTLNDKLRGFYRSTYKDQAGTVRPLAATQFEATDARRAFPCWDEPDFKAVFAATLVIDPALTAVSNTAIISETREDGKKVIRFADTILMSTYLVAFIVGPIEASKPVLVGKTPLRIWAVPGKQTLTPFAQEIAAASLKFFEEYYGIAYPGDKLDLLAIPDFASGAMENLGAITFRETALLVDRHAAAHAELERVADVIAHENAHMWFGDLVTMSWWNGLWLNEAFATFMEMLAVDAWKPAWDRWTSFGVSRAAAFAVDGLHSTRPIEYPVRAPKDAEAMFDVLTYEKGASVLRMLEQHIGPTVFRDGVRDYLRAHAYGNADTGDLWASLGKVARQPVPELMDGWIFQPGFPLVTAALSSSSTNELVLTQQRFTYLSTDHSQFDKLTTPSPVEGASAPHASPPTWQIPVQLRVCSNGHAATSRVLVKNRESRIPLPKPCETVLLNEGGHGFYRVRYEPALLERLIQGGLERLSAIERFTLLSDAWATTVAGLMPLFEYLDLTGRFVQERDRNVWAVLLESFAFLHRVIAPADRSLLERFIRGRIGPAVSELGWKPRDGENELTRQLRGELIGALGKQGNDRGIQAQAAEYYEAYRKTPTAVDPNLLAAIVLVLAHAGDAGRYQQFDERFRTAVTPQEERRYLFSLAGFQQTELLARTLDRTINGEIRTQDAPFIVSAVMGNVYGRQLAWSFVKTQWDTLDRLFPKQGLRRMCGGIVGLATPDLERDVRDFFASRKIDLGGKTLDQYLEQLRIAVTFGERDGDTLRSYLGQSRKPG